MFWVFWLGKSFMVFKIGIREKFPKLWKNIHPWLAAEVSENDWSISANPAASNTISSLCCWWGGCVQYSYLSGLLKVLSWGVSDNVSTIINAETISELLSSDLVGSLLFWLASSLTDPWHHRIVCCHLQKLWATQFKHYPLCFVMLNSQWTRFCYDWWHYTKKMLPKKNVKFSFFNFSHWH